MSTNDPRPTSSSLHPALVTVRLAALWILLGAVAKLLWGNPLDLPRLVRDLPLSLGLTFKIAIAAEAAIALLALASPRRGWLLVAALLVAFLPVLGVQVAEGAEHCGCFGGKLPLPPWATLVIDLVLLVLVLVSRPGTLHRGDWLPLAVLAPLLVLAALTPWLLDRESQGRDGSGDYVLLEFDQWPGRRIDETRLAPWVDLDRLPATGLWVFYRRTCEVCAEHLELLALRELGDRAIALIRLPDEPDAEPKVGAKPEGSFVVEIALDDRVDWPAAVPIDVILERRRVLEVRDGQTILEELHGR